MDITSEMNKPRDLLPSPRLAELSLCRRQPVDRDTLRLTYCAAQPFCQLDIERSCIGSARRSRSRLLSAGCVVVDLLSGAVDALWTSLVVARLCWHGPFHSKAIQSVPFKR